jgi:hypothetical protein
MVVDGYVVERVVGNHHGAEVRHTLRRPDGQRATLITSRGPYQDRRARSRFRRLARRRMELDHPALIPVRAFGEYEDQPYLITDLYPSRTLGDMLAEEAPLEVERIIGLLAPVADALDLAHRHGLVHQTLDSDSLLLGRDSVLLDSFGLLAAEGENLVQLGDLRYCPPEQVRGEPLTELANVYSLTALIVHALTGEPPYGGDRTALPYAQLAEAPPNVTERAPWLLPEVDEVVKWGMSKEPADRPGSATAALRAVALAAAPRVNSSRPLPTALLVTPAPRARTGPARRRRARSGALAAAIAVAAVCGAIAAAVLDPFGDEAARPAQTEDSQVWRQLVDRRAALRDALAAAKTPSEQAAAMGELARAYTAAGRAGGPARLVMAARSAGAAYADLASATEAADQSAFSGAVAEVTAAERRLVAAAAP